MVTINKGKETVEIPGCIEELAPLQYRYYLQLATMERAGAISLDYFKIRLVSYLLGLNDADFDILSADLASEIRSQVDGAVEDFLVAEGEGLHPTIMTCKNLWPESLGRKGPADYLNGMTWGEFTECSTILEMIRKDPDEAPALMERIARIMYRFDDSEIIDPFLPQHAICLFGGVWSAIQSRPIEVNGERIDFSLIFKPTGKGKPDDKTGWTGISMEVATSGVFGTMKEVSAADMWMILLFLYRAKFEFLHTKNE